MRRTRKSTPEVSTPDPWAHDACITEAAVGAALGDLLPDAELPPHTPYPDNRVVANLGSGSTYVTWASCYPTRRPMAARLAELARNARRTEGQLAALQREFRLVHAALMDAKRKAANDAP